MPITLNLNFPCLTFFIKGLIGVIAASLLGIFIGFT